MSLAPTLPSLPEIDEAHDDDHEADSDADASDANLAPFPPVAKPPSPSLPVPPAMSLEGIISAASAEPSPSPPAVRGARVGPARPDGEADVVDDDDDDDDVAAAVVDAATAAAAAAAATAVAAIVVGGGRHPGALKNCRKLLWFSSFWSADARALDELESSIAMKAAAEGGVSWVSRVA